MQRQGRDVYRSDRQTLLQRCQYQHLWACAFVDLQEGSISRLSAHINAFYHRFME